MARPAVARMFTAFSDPLRRPILHQLRGGELWVCDLVEIVKVPQPTASRHLACLKRAGLIGSRRERYWTFYTLAGQSASHKKLLECLDSCAADTPALGADDKRARTVRSRCTCCPR